MFESKENVLIFLLFKFTYVILELHDYLSDTNESSRNRIVVLFIFLIYFLLLLFEQERQRKDQTYFSKKNSN
jgi:hypothetical protein